MATVQDDVLMVVLVLGLEVPMNHIGIDVEYMLGSSVGSFDGMTYEKNLWVHCQKYLEEKDGCGYGGISMWSMKLKIRRRSGLK